MSNIIKYVIIFVVCLIGSLVIYGRNKKEKGETKGKSE